MHIEYKYIKCLSKLPVKYMFMSSVLEVCIGVD